LEVGVNSDAERPARAMDRGGEPLNEIGMSGRMVRLHQRPVISRGKMVGRFASAEPVIWNSVLLPLYLTCRKRFPE
jgi:hypothetical protein